MKCPAELLMYWEPRGIFLKQLQQTLFKAPWVELKYTNAPPLGQCCIRGKKKNSFQGMTLPSLYVF